MKKTEKLERRDNGYEINWYICSKIDKVETEMLTECSNGNCAIKCRNWIQPNVSFIFTYPPVRYITLFAFLTIILMRYRNSRLFNFPSFNFWFLIFQRRTCHEDWPYWSQSSGKYASFSLVIVFLRAVLEKLLWIRTSFFRFSAESSNQHQTQIND